MGIQRRKKKKVVRSKGYLSTLGAIFRDSIQLHSAVGTSTLRCAHAFIFSTSNHKMKLSRSKVPNLICTSVPSCSTTTPSSVKKEKKKSLHPHTMLATCTTQTIETQQPQRALPILQDYDVSPQTGFVPHPQPLARLPQAYYKPWEEIMDHLNSLMALRQLRARIDNMPQLTISHLETYPERQRAYTILCFMAHSYVWGAGLDIAQVPFEKDLGATIHSSTSFLTAFFFASAF